MNIDISVIIPTINIKNTLNIAINSVLSQKINNYEIIIVNDSLSHINFESRKIKCINLNKNYGRAKARNIGLQNANGKFICFLDDDDIFYDNHLEVLYNFLTQNNNYFAAYTSSHIVLNNSIKDFLSKKYDYDSLLVKGYIPILSVMFRKLNNIFFDENLYHNEDWDFWIRLFENKNIFYINQITNRFYHNKTEKDYKEFEKTRFQIYLKYKSKNNFIPVEIERIKILKNTEFYNSYLEELALYMYKNNLKNDLINLFLSSLKFNFKDNLKIAKIIIDSIKDLGDLKTYNILKEKFLCKQ
ncbi:MAG: glycosyl transferase [Candidatus Sericytochromatia bacterium]|nr:MAG: glycosyl transferase [Candidatus Sericytochromatia bacterium]